MKKSCLVLSLFVVGLFSFNPSAVKAQETCPVINVDGVEYSLDPCSITMSMVDGKGDVGFYTTIIGSGLYGFSRYGYGVGFPVYSVLGISSGGATGNHDLNFYFKDGVLSSEGDKPKVYEGYLPIHIYHGSETGFDNNFLNLKLKLTVLPSDATSTAMLNLDPSSPVSRTFQADSNGQYEGLPAFIFNLKTDTASNLKNLSVDLFSSTTDGYSGYVKKAYLYQGANLVSTGQIIRNNAVFKDISNAPIPQNATVQFLVKIDVAGVNSGKGFNLIPQVVPYGVDIKQASGAGKVVVSGLATGALIKVLGSSGVTLSNAIASVGSPIMDKDVIVAYQYKMSVTFTNNNNFAIFIRNESTGSDLSAFIQPSNASVKYTRSAIPASIPGDVSDTIIVIPAGASRVLNIDGVLYNPGPVSSVVYRVTSLTYGYTAENPDRYSVSSVLEPLRISATFGAGGTKCYTFTTNLTIGSTGADVVALQTTLISKGFEIPKIQSGESVKGYFNEETKDAVIAYQKSVGIEATGFVGPLTRASLNAACTAENTPEIKVLSPNGGEVWQLGTNMNISWNVPQGLPTDGRLRLRLIGEDGTIIDNLVSKSGDLCTFNDSDQGRQGPCVNINSGTYTFHLNSYEPVGKYKIEVSCFLPTTSYCLASGNSDTSDSTFSIVSPTKNPTSISVLSPTSGRKYEIGSTIPVIWDIENLNFDSYYVLLENAAVKNLGIIVTRDLPADVTNTEFVFSKNVLSTMVANSGGLTEEQLKDKYYVRVIGKKKGIFGSKVVADGVSVTFSVSTTENSKGVTVSGTKAVLGAPVMSGNVAIAYPVAFTFTLNNNKETSIYVNGTAMDILSFYGHNAPPTITYSDMSTVPPTLAGDFEKAFVIPSGSSRMFTISGIIRNADGVAGLKTLKVTGVSYKNLISDQKSETVREGLENLKISANLGGSSTVKPSIKVSSPTDGTYKAGGSMQILWSTSNIPSNEDVEIVLMLDNVGVGKPIATVKNSGSYAWKVKEIEPFYDTEIGKMIYPNGNYRIDVVCAGNSDVCNIMTPNFGQSATFTIATSTIPVTVTCPVGYICNPAGSRYECPSGYTCKVATLNCPSGYTCTALVPKTATQTPSPTNSPNATSGNSLKASLLTTNTDKAGTWYTFSPGKGAGGIGGTTDPADWNWSSTLVLTGEKTIGSVTIRQTNGEYWSTNNTAYFPLVIIDANGKQLTSQYTNNLTTLAKGIYQWTLFGQKNTSAWVGGSMVILFSDGTKLLTDIPAMPRPDIPLPQANFQIDSSTGSMTRSSGYYMFSWDSTNSDYCTASGDTYWSGNKATKGAERIWAGNEKTGSTLYSITCGVSSGKVNPVSVSIRVYFSSSVASPTPTPYYSTSPTPTPYYYSTPTPTPYLAPTPTPYVAPSPTPTPYVVSTPTPTPYVAPTPTPTSVVAPTPSPSSTPTAYPSPSTSPRPSASPTAMMVDEVRVQASVWQAVAEWLMGR